MAIEVSQSQQFANSATAKTSSEVEDIAKKLSMSTDVRKVVL